MNAPAAIQGTFADFKLVRGRKVAQFIVEVPIEGADQALKALGGIPNPSTETWVALARLNAKPSASSQSDAEPGEAPGGRRRFNELSPAQQSALKCKDEAFQRFMSETGYAASMKEDDVASGVRAFCGIKSRARLNENRAAANLWRTLHGEFQLWMQAVDA